MIYDSVHILHKAVKEKKIQKANLCPCLIIFKLLCLFYYHHKTTKQKTPQISGTHMLENQDYPKMRQTFIYLVHLFFFFYFFFYIFNTKTTNKHYIFTNT